MKYIFLDTNIFFHFQYFEAIDWLSEASTSECKLMISPIVVDELDEKKIGTNKLSSKARKVLNRLEALMDIDNAEVQEKVFIEVILNKPQKKTYEEYELNFNEQDHRLIASILEFRDKKGDVDIVLCTNDIGPRLRAKQYGITPLKLNEKYLLPFQESEEEKTIKKLERENRALKNKIPILSLRFSDSKEFVQFHVQSGTDVDFEEFKSKVMDDVKSKNAYMEHVDPFKNPAALISQNMLGLTAEQINSFNEKLDTFFNAYEKAIVEFYENENRKNLIFEFNLVLVNSGNTPAEDIDIHLHFPDGFELIETDELNDDIELPEPPYRPKNQFDLGSSPISSFPSFYPNLEVGSNIKFNSPTIKKINSYDVDFYRKSLKHGYPEELESLSVVFGNYEEIKNFQIEYEISAANMPDKIKGQLNVIFKK